MKNILFALVLTAAAVSAQNITKVTTLVAKSATTNSMGAPVIGNATNQFFLPAGEAARVSSTQLQTLGTASVGYWYVRDGWWWECFDGTVVEGPVWFVIELTTSDDSAARLTLERWKVAKK